MVTLRSRKGVTEKAILILEIVMTNNLQSSITKFYTEARLLEGAENVVLELSDECRNCIMLSGQIYGLLVLARELSVLYERPE